jgi:methionyl-tRNA formyltransferase
MMSNLKIDILVDNKNSWICPWVEKFVDILNLQGYGVSVYQDMNKLHKGDVAFFLSCNKIVPRNILSLHKHNIVVHPSKLPEGRGFSPLAWQILENKREIVLSLFDAVEDVDAGPIYFQSVMVLEGHELNNEIKELQGKVTLELCLKFLQAYPNINPIKSNEEIKPTYCKRRGVKDSELCLSDSLENQFNLMRVADNERYPLYFIKDGYKYVLTVHKEGT